MLLCLLEKKSYFVFFFKLPNITLSAVGNNMLLLLLLMMLNKYCL